MRSRSTTEFQKQFTEATKISKLLFGNEFQLTTPRLTCGQAHRSNPPSATPEEYYRISLYNEFLSHLLAELELDEDSDVPEELTKAVKLFEGDLPHAGMFRIDTAPG
ncbi:52 kDa repressor of the inhibitor of the protein kinase [Oopsacas minuta]|uniref:52 kDa repressor of the inhibitor of the protein kinase n=1 Tax=Oopsacas minuta TaxID=111878 RepID=A0AAV7K2C7_9METZ|nr:52 kDa repressor of the inhibitor of the protein kinase [Oopsacas minuta]